MNAIIEIRPRVGRFVGRIVFTNRGGRGIFTRLDDGTWTQHAGTMQTPTFRSAQQLARYVRLHFRGGY